MAADGEQKPPKRRTNVLVNKEPTALIYPHAGDKITSAPNTDGFHADEGLTSMRSNTSAIRHYGYTQTTSSQRAIQPAQTPIPPRRQKTQTSDLPAPRQKVQTSDLPTQRPKTQTSDLPTQRSAQRQTRTFEAPPPTPEKAHRLKNMHWLFLVGLGMTAALLLWLLGSAALSWGIQRYNDVRYGTPRTSQIDQVVGHGGDSAAHPSHFIAINLNDKAVVIELKAGDPAQSISYVAPVYIVGDNGQAPVTLEFRDVNGDHKLDMVIHIHLPPNQDQVSVFINDGDKFRPSNNNDALPVS